MNNPGEVRDATIRAIDEARGASTAIIRRYRRAPSPLVRDSVRGWRTGRIDLIFEGNFDLVGSTPEEDTEASFSDDRG